MSGPQRVLGSVAGPQARNVNIVTTERNCGNKRINFRQHTFHHDKGQKSAISGRRLHWIFLKFLQ